MSILLSQDKSVESQQSLVSLTKPALSFIFPIFNGGKEAAPKIVKWIETVGKNLPAFEVLVVDDGSIDDTYKALKAIDVPQLKVVKLDTNRGKGAALKFGFGFVSGDVVIFADGDLQALPSNFSSFIDSLQESHAAIASKRVPGSEVVAGPRRKFLSIGFNCIVRLLLSLPLVDTQAGFKVFRRSALQKIIPLISVKAYAFDVELLVIANLLGMRIAERPASVKLGSSFRSRSILRMFVDVLGIAYRLRIKRWYQKNIADPSSKYSPILKWQ